MADEFEQFINRLKAARIKRDNLADKARMLQSIGKQLSKRTLKTITNVNENMKTDMQNMIVTMKSRFKFLDPKALYSKVAFINACATRIKDFSASSLSKRKHIIFLFEQFKTLEENMTPQKFQSKEEVLKHLQYLEQTVGELDDTLNIIEADQKKISNLLDNLDSLMVLGNN